MFKSLDEIYNALAHGQPAPVAAPSYIDFIEDNARYQASPRYAQDRAYWLDKYRQMPEPLLLPRHPQRQTGPAAQTQVYTQPLPTLLHERMKQVARAYGASAFHVLLAALHVYFSRSTQRDEWVVGCRFSTAPARASNPPRAVRPGQRGAHGFRSRIYLR
jgi:arthrofactin-type cyclic lipopeptide synthetase A